jgi:hypothetical protein
MNTMPEIKVIPYYLSTFKPRKLVINIITEQELQELRAFFNTVTRKTNISRS